MCLGVGNVTKNGKALLAKVHEICGKEVLLDILKDMESVWNTKDGDIKYVLVGCAQRC